jgi:hypothetical protein
MTDKPKKQLISELFDNEFTPGLTPEQYQMLENENQHKDSRMLKHNLTTALVALLDIFLNDSMFNMAESFNAEVVSATGLQGGDYGNGGALEIRFSTNFQDTNGIRFDPDRRGNCIIKGSQGGSVSLTACGDWEQAGLVGSLAYLLRELLPVYSPKKE